MKKLSIKLILLVLLFQGLTSCKSEDTPPVVTNQDVTGEITQNTTWTADKIYVLNGKVIVNDNVTLTIEPGTIIKGKEGDELNASALIVARGGKIMAEGTAAKPIIFTSVIDNIELGQLSGTNLNETDIQKWGGLIILGKGKVSDKVGDTEGHIEGIPADADYGTYGGNDNADNSGVLKYVSIRHGGISIGDGNEINGLTLGGVGSGTVIDYVEIVATLDDGIECFGGAAVINHALVAYQQDDAFDVDQNFAGTFKNSMVVYNDSGDEFLEIDGPENDTNTDGLFTVENCKFISKTNNGTADLKSKAQGTIQNNVFEGLLKFKVSAKFESDCTTPKTDAYDHYIDGTLVIQNNQTDAVIDVYTKSEDALGNTCTLPAGYQTDAETIYNAAGNSSTTNVSLSVSTADFAGWTWTAIHNKF